MNAQTGTTHIYPLSMAAEGESVQVVTATGGKTLLRRLVAMGIMDGSELEVINRHTDSGIVIRCGENRWSIGQSMAQKVLVCAVLKMKMNNNISI